MGWLSVLHTQAGHHNFLLPNFSARRELAGTQAAEMSSGFLCSRHSLPRSAVGRHQRALGDFPGCGRHDLTLLWLIFVLTFLGSAVVQFSPCFYFYFLLEKITRLSSVEVDIGRQA